MANVSNIVKSIQDIMRKDAGTYGDAQRLEQFGWTFFFKIFDDREMNSNSCATITNRRCSSTCAGATGLSMPKAAVAKSRR